MSITKTLIMAFKSIANSKMRSFLTMLGIIIGVASVISLVSATQAQQKIYMMQMDAMGVNRIDMYMYMQSDRAVRDIVSYAENDLSEYITAFSPATQSWREIGYRTKTMKDTRIHFGNENYMECTSQTLSAGRNITASDVKNRARVCVIGDAVRKSFFGAMSPIGQYIKIEGQNYKVIGVMDGKYGGKLNTDDQMVIVPHTLQLRIMGWEDNSDYVASAKDIESSQLFVEKVSEYANNKSTSDWDYFYAYSNAQYQEQMSSYANQSSLMLGGIAGISLLVGGIGIMNIMLVTVTERTREIGIRMAIGARRRDIIGQFLIEAAVVSACGGILGIALGYFGAAMLGTLMIGPMANQPWIPDSAAQLIARPSMGMVIFAFLFSVLLGILFGLYPANKASKMQPVDALRTQ